MNLFVDINTMKVVSAMESSSSTGRVDVKLSDYLPLNLIFVSNKRGVPLPDGSAIRVTGKVPGDPFSAPLLLTGSFSQTGPDTAGSLRVNMGSSSIYYLELIAGGSGYTSAPTVSFSGDGSGATAVATISSSSVQDVTVNAGGSGYSGAPYVQIIPHASGGTGAEAVVNLTSTGTVGSFTVTNPGTGYATAPTAVLVGGSGTGAAATVQVVPGSIDGIHLTERGSGYNPSPVVTFTGGGSTRAATARAVTAAGKLTKIELLDPGAGYTSAPVVNISDGGGGTAVATIGGAGTLESLSLISGGSGYAVEPVVTFTGGGGKGASAEAIVDNGVVTSIVVTSNGTGYTSAPSVSLIGGSGSGATCAAEMSSVKIKTIELTNPGSGYDTTRTVGFSGGGGTGAAATLRLNGAGGVEEIQLTNPGSGYTSAPSLNFGSGWATTPVATAQISSGVFDEVVVTNPGSGYVAESRVVFTGGGGTGAAGTVREIQAATTASLDTYTIKVIGTPLANMTASIFGTNRFGTPIKLGTATYSSLWTRDWGWSDTSNVWKVSLNVSSVEIGLYSNLRACVWDQPQNAIPNVTVYAEKTGTSTAGTPGIYDIQITATGTGYTSPPTLSFLGAYQPTGAKTFEVTLDGTSVVSARAVGYTSFQKIININSAKLVVKYNGVETGRYNCEVDIDGSTGGIARVLPHRYNYYGGRLLPSSFPADRTLSLEFTNPSQLGGSGVTIAPVVVRRIVTGFDIATAGLSTSLYPTVDITGGGGTGATAHCTIVGDKISSINLTNPGSGYTSAPDITISGGTLGASGATAVAVMEAGTVSGVKVLGGGGGYLPPTLVIAPPPSGVAATGSLIVSNGAVVSAKLESSGSGYTAAPVVSVVRKASQEDELAQATAIIINDGSVAKTSVSVAGSGYGAAPLVIFAGGGGSGASGTARVYNGRVVDVQMISGGVGYQQAPSVVFVRQTPANANIGSALKESGVSSITITNPGDSYDLSPSVTLSGGGGTLAAAEVIVAPDGTLSLVRLTSGGIGYTSAPTIAISAPGAGVTATAKAGYLEPRVGGLTVTAEGSGYIAPVVSVELLGGGGSGASATATVVGDEVRSITVTDPGSGYTSAPEVVISTPKSGSGASGTLVVSAGVITGVTLVSGGSGYTSGILISAPTGTGAVITATRSAGVITGFVVGSGGTGYANGNSIVISPVAVGVGASATCAFDGGRVNSVTLLSHGDNYSDNTTAQLTGGGGSGASVKVNMRATRVTSGVKSVEVIDPGSGHITPPTVKFTGFRYYDNYNYQSLNSANKVIAEAIVADGKVAHVEVLQGGYNWTPGTYAELSPPPFGYAGHLNLGTNALIAALGTNPYIDLDAEVTINLPGTVKKSSLTFPMRVYNDISKENGDSYPE